MPSEKRWNFACGCRAVGWQVEELTMVEPCAGHVGMLARIRAAVLDEVERELLRIADGEEYLHIKVSDLLSGFQRLKEGGRRG